MKYDFSKPRPVHVPGAEIALPAIVPLQAGDILAYSWGWEQTNVDFFQVVRATAKSVWIRPIAGTEISDGPTSMTGTVKPVINRFTGPVKRKKIQQPESAEPFVDMSYGIAKRYERPMRVSHYA